MKLLALDTSTDACTVGLRIDDDTDVLHVVEPRAHTARLLPMIDELLQAHDCDVADLDAIVLGNGPGSFIGMRIGASVAQGLAWGSGRPIVPVSSLAAVAAAAMTTSGHELVAVAQDARMGEVYLGWFRRNGEGLPLASGDVRLHDARRPLQAEEAFALAGAASRRYPQLAEGLPTGSALLGDVDCPNAAQLLALGARAFAEGRSVAPERLEPAYVRQRVAAVPAR